MFTSLDGLWPAILVRLCTRLNYEFTRIHCLLGVDFEPAPPDRPDKMVNCDTWLLECFEDWINRDSCKLLFFL